MSEAAATRVVSAVEGAEVAFRLDDPEHDLSAVRLWAELGLPGESLDFYEVEGGWELRLPRPTVHRMEYLFEVTGADGEHAMRVDPSNPRLVGGPFGEHSVLELPGYTAPPWADVEPVPSVVSRWQSPAPRSARSSSQVWAPADADPAEPLPLLVSHDGPELAAYAGLTQYAGAMVAAEELPRMRLALVAPGERNSVVRRRPRLRGRARPPGAAVAARGVLDP